MILQICRQGNAEGEQSAAPAVVGDGVPGTALRLRTLFLCMPQRFKFNREQQHTVRLRVTDDHPCGLPNRNTAAANIPPTAPSIHSIQQAPAASPSKSGPSLQKNPVFSKKHLLIRPLMWYTDNGKDACFLVLLRSFRRKEAAFL